MWPWGHFAFAYVLYSLSVHAIRRRAPETGAVLALALGSQLPDLVDKPLAWIFHISPSGYSVAHSAFVAFLVGGALVALAVVRDRTAIGVGFVLGWWSHLVGDVLFAILLRNPYAVSRIMWPLIVLPADPRGSTALDHVLYYVLNWVEFLAAVPSVVLLLYVGPLALAGLLWLVDGAPGFPRRSWFQ